MLTAEEVPPVAKVLCYLQYLVVLFFGRLRDLLGGITGISRYNVHTPKGYAPLLDSFSSFYTRRFYERFSDCFNHPIAGPPTANVNVVKRYTLDGNKSFISTDEVQTCINMGSYNNLGFADDWMSTCSKDVFAAIDKYGHASSSSNMDFGTTPLHEELESEVAAYVGKPDAVVCTMGYGTNATSIPTLMGKGSLIISDALNHTSIVNGSRDSGAVIAVLKHNDPKYLEKLLRRKIAEGQPKTGRAWTKILVMVEGIYSMEGEIVDLRGMVDACKKYKAYIYVDEAHSIGALGKNGRGVCEQTGVDPSEIDILMGTFSKSFAGVGGYVASSKEICDHIRRASRGAMYSPILSVTVVQQVLTALKMVEGKDGTTLGRQKLDSLRNNCNYVRQRLMDMGLVTLGHFDSPVIPVMLYHMSKVRQFNKECMKRGVAVVTVAFPAIPVLLGRVRICVSAAHKREDLDKALNVIEEVSEICHVQFLPKKQKVAAIAA